MTRYRALVEPRYVIVEAEDAYTAQLAAYAQYILRLSPRLITVEPVGKHDDWMEEAKA